MYGLDIGLEEIIRVYSMHLPVKIAGSDDLTSREVIIDHRIRGGLSGLYSISGVKFTTSRAVAEKFFNYVTSQELQGLQRTFPSQELTRPAPNTCMLDGKMRS